MTNSSDTFKTGEKATRAGTYQCLDCAQRGKTTTIHVEQDAIFPHCATCETKDATYRLTAAPVAP